MVFPDFQTEKEINGWFYDKEGEIYNNLVSKIYDGNILEIGSFHGLSLSYIVETCKKNRNHIYAIDIRIRDEFLENINNWGAKNIIAPLQISSQNAARQFRNNFFDLIFIDGNHFFKSVWRDVVSWWPKLKLQGILLGHDYNWKEVQRVVDILLPNSFKFDRFWLTKKLENRLLQFRQFV